MAILKVKGVGIKDPSKLNYGLQDMDAEAGSGRNQDGEMLRDRVGTKVKLECEWSALSRTEMAALLSAVTDVFFDIEYPDAKTGNRQTKSFYVGDRNAPMYHALSDTEWQWQGLRMNFIER